MAEVTLRFKRLAPQKLEPYGFKKDGDGYIYTTDILEGAFRMDIRIVLNGVMETHLFDINSEEEYVLHLVAGSVGEFVGSVREAYEAVIDDIAAKCYETEIIDLRIQPEKMEDLVDNEKYFPGWHMNKKHWYTICLDGAVPTEEICERIDESFMLAVK